MHGGTILTLQSIGIRSNAGLSRVCLPVQIQDYTCLGWRKMEMMKEVIRHICDPCDNIPACRDLKHVQTVGTLVSSLREMMYTLISEGCMLMNSNTLGIR